MDTLAGLNASMRHARPLELKVRNPADGIQNKLEALDQVTSVQACGRDFFVIESEPDVHLQDEVARLALDQHCRTLAKWRPLGLIRNCEPFSFTAKLK